jgi:integrase
MATIIKRGDRHLARVRKLGFTPVSQSFIRKSDAIAWGRRVEADMEGGRWSDPATAVPSLKDAIADYRIKVAVRLKGAREYGYSFKDIEVSSIGGRKLDELKPIHLAEWRDALSARGLKPATVLRRLGLLSSVLSWCHKEMGWITENPMRSVRKPTVRDERTRTLVPEEVRYLGLATAAARACWLPDAIAVLMRTAMRRSELVQLRCRDVDLGRSVAKLYDTKNGEGREVPLCPQAKVALGRLMAAAAARGGAGVLPIEDPEAVSFAFRRAVVRARARYEEDCASAGLLCDPGFMNGIRLHDLRHHSLSEWARTGALSLFDLLKVSGHKSPRMLARYVNLDSAQVAAKMAAIPSAN